MKKTGKKGFGGVLLALLLAIELAVLADIAAAYWFRPLPPLYLGAGALAVFLALARLPISRRRLCEDVLGLLLLAAVLVLAATGFLSLRARSTAYAAVDSGKRALYAGHRVLFAVPQPGDEVALADGLAEAYLRYGSEVSLLFYDSAGDRGAALNAAARIGLREEQVLFPGSSGPSETLRDAMLSLWPDLVLGAESERRGTVLRDALDAVREQAPAYAPLVFQSLPVSARAAAPSVFYQENLPSTQVPETVPASLWAERLRLPVDAASLSRSLLNTAAWSQLLGYGRGREEAERAVLGDRVFWPVGDSSADGAGTDFVKLSDAEGNFLYDYYIDPRGRATFSLYTVGKADQPYSVSVDGERCTAKIGQDRSLDVLCPKNRSCIITVTSADGAYWDTIVVSNPGRFARATGQSIERWLLHVRDDVWPQTNSFRFGLLGWQLLREKLAA